MTTLKKRCPTCNGEWKITIEPAASGGVQWLVSAYCKNCGLLVSDFVSAQRSRQDFLEICIEAITAEWISQS